MYPKETDFDVSRSFAAGSNYNFHHITIHLALILLARCDYKTPQGCVEQMRKYKSEHTCFQYVTYECAFTITMYGVLYLYESGYVGILSGTEHR